MGKIEKYYENTKDALPHKNIKEFIKISDKQGKAIEIVDSITKERLFCW